MRKMGYNHILTLIHKDDNSPNNGRTRFISNNKRGVILAYVIIIGAALFIIATMSVVVAKSAISTSDSGIKSREAYLSAKSGIEFAKTQMDSTTTAALSSLEEEVADMEAARLSSPPAIDDVEIDNQTLYGYGSLAAGFVFSEDGTITPNSSKYKYADIKIKYEVQHDITTGEAIGADEGAVSYNDHITIIVNSIGNSANAPAISGLFNRGISLTYTLEADVFTNSSGETSNVIPDTNGIPVNSVWPTEEIIPGSHGTILRGGSTFVYDGDYYINLYRTWVFVGTEPWMYPDILLINPGVALNVDRWPKYKKGQPVGISSQVFRHFYGVNLVKGDKIVRNGIYYVLGEDYISWVNPPSGNDWPWFEIPGQ